MGGRRPYLAEAAQATGPSADLSRQRIGSPVRLRLDERERKGMAWLSEKTPPSKSGGSVASASVCSELVPVGCRRLEGTHRWVGLMGLAE